MYLRSHSGSHTVQGTEDTAVRQSDTVGCPHGVYILVLRDRK